MRWKEWPTIHPFKSKTISGVKSDILKLGEKRNKRVTFNINTLTCCGEIWSATSSQILNFGGNWSASYILKWIMFSLKNFIFQRHFLETNSTQDLTVTWLSLSVVVNYCGDFMRVGLWWPFWCSIDLQRKWDVQKNMLVNW